MSEEDERVVSIDLNSSNTSSSSETIKTNEIEPDKIDTIVIKIGEFLSKR
jgi:hypothetical protein